MKLSEMKNIGPQSERWLMEAGITTPEQLSELGAVAAYQRVREAQPGAMTMLLYALQGALLDIHWNSLSPEMKADLRAQVDAQADETE